MLFSDLSLLHDFFYALPRVQSSIIGFYSIFSFIPYGSFYKLSTYFYKLLYKKVYNIYFKFLNYRLSLFFRCTRSNCFVTFTKKCNILKSLWLGYLGIKKKKYRMINATFVLFSELILKYFLTLTNFRNFNRVNVVFSGYKRFFRIISSFISFYFSSATDLFNNLKVRRAYHMLRRIRIMKFCAQYQRPFVISRKQFNQDAIFYQKFLRATVGYVLLSKVEYHLRLSFGFHKTGNPKMFRYY